MRPLFDWPPNFTPARASIRFLTTVQDGLVSRSSYESSVAIPGGRAELMMDFDPQWGTLDSLAASWLASRLRGNLFRVPVPLTAQIARNSDLGLADGLYSRGIPFDGDVFFDEGTGFAFEPTVDTAGAALSGMNTIVINQSRWPGVIRPGRWIGFGFGCHHVDDATPGTGDLVTVEVSPPFRRDFASGEFVSLRPSIVCQAVDTSSFTSMFDAGEIVRSGSITMREARDEQFL